MIHHVFKCNICEGHIAWHPASLADCLSLLQRGPVGLENSVLIDDECDAPYARVHICRVCEGALSKYFKEKEAA